MRKFVGVILFKGENVYLQRRDTVPGLPYSGELAIFGGHVDDGEEFIDAAVRELGEETDLGIREADLTRLDEYHLPPDTPEGIPERHYAVYMHELSETDFEVYEGVGYEVYSIEQVQAMLDAGKLGQGALEALAEYIKKYRSK